MWGAVFQGSLLFVSSGDFLKMEVDCFFRKISIPDCYVAVLKDKIPMLFGFSKIISNLNRGGSGLG